MSYNDRGMQNHSGFAFHTADIFQTESDNARGIVLTRPLHYEMLGTLQTDRDNARGSLCTRPLHVPLADIISGRRVQRPWPSIHSPVALHNLEQTPNRLVQRPWQSSTLGRCISCACLFSHADCSNARGILATRPLESTVPNFQFSGHDNSPPLKKFRPRNLTVT